MHDSSGEIIGLGGQSRRSETIEGLRGTRSRNRKMTENPGKHPGRILALGRNWHLLILSERAATNLGLEPEGVHRFDRLST